MECSQKSGAQTGYSLKRGRVIFNVELMNSINQDQTKIMRSHAAEVIDKSFCSDSLVMKTSPYFIKTTAQIIQSISASRI